MKGKWIFVLSAAGLVIGVVSAYVFGLRQPAQTPVFKPAQNPYASGIYATGIIESSQASGENVPLHAEVPGTVSEVLVTEGQAVKKGAPLVAIDDSVQRALVEQQQAQAAAALAQLELLKAQPRKETFDVAGAQVQAAAATSKSAADSYDKLRRAVELNPQSVSREALDSAANAAAIAAANLEVQRKQFELTKAGAWSFDIRNQENQYRALAKAAAAGTALLSKYVIKAPADGVVLSVNAAVGAYVSAQGVFDSYSSGYAPVAVLGSPQAELAVRCYVDEILVQRLPRPPGIHARMSIHGTQISVPMDYVRTQPFVTPKIELTNQRQERVDLRVLPLIFKFKAPAGVVLYPGQIVDVYIEEGDAAPAAAGTKPK